MTHVAQLGYVIIFICMSKTILAHNAWTLSIVSIDTKPNMYKTGCGNYQRIPRWFPPCLQWIVPCHKVSDNISHLFWSSSIIRKQLHQSQFQHAAKYLDRRYVFTRVFISINNSLSYNLHFALYAELLCIEDYNVFLHGQKSLFNEGQL